MTGTVRVTSSDGDVLGTGAVGRGNVVLMTVSAAQLGVGSHQLLVSHGGDGEFRPSSTAVNLTVTSGPGSG